MVSNVGHMVSKLRHKILCANEPQAKKISLWEYISYKMRRQFLIIASIVTTFFELYRDSPTLTKSKFLSAIFRTAAITLKAMMWLHCRPPAPP